MTDTTITEHPNVTRYREMYDLVFAGDLYAVWDHFDDDVEWFNGPAAGPWAGPFHGRLAVFAMMAEFMQEFEGNFRQEVHDVLGTDDHVVALLHEVGEHPSGHRFDNRAAYVLHMVEGRVVAGWTMDLDVDAAAEFWAAVRPG